MWHLPEARDQILGGLALIERGNPHVLDHETHVVLVAKDLCVRLQQHVDALAFNRPADEKKLEALRRPQLKRLVAIAQENVGDAICPPSRNDCRFSGLIG
jgi:hypothetical protein